MRTSDPVSSFYSAGLKQGLDFNQLLLQGAQRVRRYQMEQIDAALSECAALSEQVDAASNQDPSNQDPLHALWSSVAYRPVDRTINYWNGLCSVLAQNQIELAGECRSQVQHLAGGFMQRPEVAPAAVSDPMATTLKMMALMARSKLGNAPPRGPNGAGLNGAAARKNGSAHNNQPPRKNAAAARAAAP